MRKLTVGAVLVLAMNANVFAFGPYVGAKTAWLSPDVSGVSFDAAINAGLVLGYVFEQNFGLAVEAEFTTSISDGKWTYLASSGDFDISTKALYFVARPGERAYLKIKAGYLDGDISLKKTGVASFNNDGSGFSWGLGGGFHVTDNFSAEVEWTQVASDIDGLSLGVNYSFD